MTDADQTTAVARERADKRIDTALGELHAAANEIGIRHGIPEGIAGHSIEELLGRMAYIPSMARDLRRACGQELAKDELNKLFDAGPTKQAAKPEVPPPPPPPTIEPSKIPGNIPVGMDVGDLQGVTVQAVKALKLAGLSTIGEVMKIPDEHLAKVHGLGDKSVAQIRLAIAKAGEKGLATS